LKGGQGKKAVTVESSKLVYLEGNGASGNSAVGEIGETILPDQRGGFTRGAERMNLDTVGVETSKAVLKNNRTRKWEKNKAIEFSRYGDLAK